MLKHLNHYNNNYNNNNSYLPTTTLTNSAVPSSSKSNNNAAVESINFLCIDISKFSRTIQFILLVIATLVFFLLYGYMQELLYKLPGFGQYPWYLTLIQFLFYSMFAYTEKLLRNEGRRR